MDYEGIMLSEINQAEKDKYCMISTICGILNKQELTEKEIRLVVLWLPEEGALDEGSQKVQTYS